jgi:hypothetical protein
MGKNSIVSAGSKSAKPYDGRVVRGVKGAVRPLFSRISIETPPALELVLADVARTFVKSVHQEIIKRSKGMIRRDKAGKIVRRLSKEDLLQIIHCTSDWHRLVVACGYQSVSVVTRGQLKKILDASASAKKTDELKFF